MMIQDRMKEGFDSVRENLGRDEILAALGLERRRSTFEMLLPAAGIFAAGVLVGTGVALLTAPRSGREVRRALKDKATDLGHRIETSAGDMAGAVRESLSGHGEGTDVDKTGSGAARDNGGNRRNAEAGKPHPAPLQHK